jgi:hypothetical protein
MKFSFDMNLLLGAPSLAVKIPTGDDAGFGVEGGRGSIKLVTGSVNVFSGP